MALLTALAGCSATPEVTAPEADLDATDRAACEAFTEALPGTLNGLGVVDVEPADALGAAYGDPAIVVSCGVALPEEFDPFATCDDVNGVGWFAPPSTLEESAQDETATVTAISHRPLVQVVVPPDYRPDGVFAALNDLTEAITATLRLEQPCL